MFLTVYLHNWLLGPSGKGEVKTAPERYPTSPNGHFTYRQV